MLKKCAVDFGESQVPQLSVQVKNSKAKAVFSLNTLMLIIKNIAFEISSKQQNSSKTTKVCTLARGGSCLLQMGVNALNV